MPRSRTQSPMGLLAVGLHIATSGGAKEILTPDPLLAKPITRLLVVKPHLPSCEDAIKAYKAIVR